MQKTTRTDVSAMKIRDPHIDHQDIQQQTPQIEWRDVPDVSRGQSMLKNVGVAAALVLCAVTLRTGAIPPLSEAADAVLTAATDHPLLDEPLGKLSFVSALFPETVLVFGEQYEQELSLPVSGGMVVHAWSETEPYMTMRSSSFEVISAAEGEVIGVYHGNGEERLIQIAHDDGLTCLYGNMESVEVSTGDFIPAGTVLGKLLPGEDLVFEVRQNGFSVDPAKYLPQ